jgi:hypothetical protein
MRMKLKIQQNSTNGSKYGTGIFINKVRIIGVTDRTGEKPSGFSTTPDLWLVLTLDIGKEFNPEMSFVGNFKRDNDTNEVTDWGSATTIKYLFVYLGIEGSLTEKDTLPHDMLKQLLGKEFYRLQYISRKRQDGKLIYADWYRIDTDNPERLARAFFKSLEKGYPKDYNPHLLDQTEEADLSGPWDEEESTFKITDADL